MCLIDGVGFEFVPVDFGDIACRHMQRPVLEPQGIGEQAVAWFEEEGMDSITDLKEVQVGSTPSSK